MRYVNQTVSDVQPGSPGDRAGIRRGETLLSINGQPVCDLIDYEYLTANRALTLVLMDGQSRRRTLRIKKDEYEPLGLNFATSLMSSMRTCKNRCVFCFIDQMPKGGRTSLHVKDDDWRMSFIMGNYVSLTNVDEAEFDRILARRVSPLYISLHAADPAVRTRMMANPNAGAILQRLRRLKEAGLQFHLQIVLCPGLNDGAVLADTLSQVETLVPGVQSLAIVPVGLTKFRENLYPLRGYTPEEAAALIDTMEARQAAYLAQYGTRLCYLSDEWYLLAGRPLPPYEAYEDFPQIENGVGLIRLTEEEVFDALSEHTPRKRPARFAVVSGRSAVGHFGAYLPEKLRPYGVELDVLPVQNDFFGGNVTVSGLLTGGDIVRQLRGKIEADTLLLPRNMLREKDDVFLDNMRVSQLAEALDKRVLPFSDGGELVEILFTGEET